MKIAALGPEGTFSHELATRLYGEDEIVLLPTIRTIFECVESGEMDALIPLENSLAGGVGATLDGLRRYDVFITAEAYMVIRHCLVGFSPVHQLKVLYTHPQTHGQCSDFIERLGRPVLHTTSNAASARECLTNVNSGAITSYSAASVYGIPVICHNVQDSPANITRFVRISQRPEVTSRPEKCSICIDPASDRAGLLFDLLGVFARRHINLTRIESRPARSGMGSYVFFLDIEVAEGWEDAIEELRVMAAVKNFGCYRKSEVPEWM